MNDYEGYLNLTIPAGEEYEIDGVIVFNNTNREFHLFCKLIEPQEIIDLTIEGEEND